MPPLQALIFVRVALRRCVEDVEGNPHPVQVLRTMCTCVEYVDERSDAYQQYPRFRLGSAGRNRRRSGEAGPDDDSPDPAVGTQRSGPMTPALATAGSAGCCRSCRGCCCCGCSWSGPSRKEVASAAGCLLEQIGL